MIRSWRTKRENICELFNIFCSSPNCYELGNSSLVMKPVFSHLKKPLKVIPGLSVESPTEILTVDLEQASPMKNHEQQLSLVVSKKPIDREGHGQNFYKFQLDGFMNSACCRLLIFWSVITTLSSVVSIYYAIDAQSRLTEAHDRYCVSSIHLFL